MIAARMAIAFIIAWTIVAKTSATWTIRRIVSGVREIVATIGTWIGASIIAWATMMLTIAVSAAMTIGKTAAAIRMIVSPIAAKGRMIAAMIGIATAEMMIAVAMAIVLTRTVVKRIVLMSKHEASMERSWFDMGWEGKRLLGRMNGIYGWYLCACLV
jgi:hypothetical protein